MALQSSGQITLSEIWSEYNSGATPATDQNISLGTLSANTADGGGDPDAMSEFYGLSSAPAFVANDNFAISTYTGNGGTQSITSAAVGKAAYFNGTSGRITTGLTLPADSTMSFSFWLKFDSNPSGNNYFLSDFDSGANNNSTRISLAITANHGFRAWVSNGSSNWNTTDAIDLSHYLDKWFNLVVTLNGSTMKVYVNGGSPTTFTMSISFGTAGSRQLTIGRAGDLAGAYYEGHLDDIRIYTKELSATEVSYIANNNISSIPTGNLLAHYKLDGNANDAQGSYNGTASNITYTSNAAISSIAGLGQAAHFSGSTSVSTPSVITLSGLDSTLCTQKQTVSVSLWFNTTATTSGELFGTYAQQSFNLRIFINANGTIQAQNRYNNNTTDLITTASYNDGAWHHVVGVVDTSGNDMQLYIDNGTPLNSSISTAGWYSTSSAYADTTLGNLRYSADTNPSSQYYYINEYKGAIDQVRIYSSALTSANVSSLYNESSVPTSNLLAHYKLDGNANDETGNYNGTASNVGWVGSNFKPDFVWIKNRDRAISHILTDSLRGPTKTLRTDLTNAEITNTNDLQSFDSTGFTVGLNTRVNYSGEDFVAWTWKAGGAGVPGGGTNVTNVTQSVNADAGFSIVKYTEASSGASSFNHGLGVQPDLTILKRLNATGSWLVLTNAIDGSYDYLILDSTAAAATSSYSSNSTSVSVDVANGSTFITYNFVSIDGYQRVGTYQGNGGVKTVYTDSNGDNTGTGAFKPRWVLIKNTTTSSNWMIYDSVRDTDGNVSLFLEANTADAEANASTAYIVPNSTGWTTGTSNSAHLNRSGDTFIYLAIA